MEQLTIAHFDRLSSMLDRSVLVDSSLYFTISIRITLGKAHLGRGNIELAQSSYDRADYLLSNI